MTSNNNEWLREYLYRLLLLIVGEDYASAIADNDAFFSAVWKDIEASSSWRDDGEYNDDDIRMAVGRVLFDALRIER